MMNEVVDNWIAVITAGLWNSYCIQHMKKLGYKVLAFDQDPNAPGFKWADKKITVDINDEKAVINALIETKIRPCGATSMVSDAGAYAAVAIREKYNLPGPNRKVTERMKNKYLQRKIWSEHGLNVPEWILIEADQDASYISKKLDHPFVIKPIDSSGSRGVEVLFTDESLNEHIRSARNFSRDNCIIAESYIDGTEYSVETFTHEGVTNVLTISERIRFNFTTAIQIHTASISENLRIKIGDLVCRALQSLEFNSGPAHTEVIVSTDGIPFLVETAGRGGGFRIFDLMIKEVTGFDIVQESINQIVGKRPNIFEQTSSQQRFGVLRFLHGDPGKVISLAFSKTLLKLRKNEEKILTEFLVAEGDYIKKIANDSDRSAYIIAFAKTFARASRLAEDASQSVKIKTIK